MFRCVTLLLLVCALPTLGGAESLWSGSLRVDLTSDPFALAFVDADGTPVLSSASGGDGTVPGGLSARTDTGWIDAMRVSAIRRDGRGLRATLATDDPLGGIVTLDVDPEGEGVLAVAATFSGGAVDAPRAIGAAWAASPDERFYGLGERATTTQHRGTEVESYVSDGPWIEADRPLIRNVLPPPGFRPRNDATYFPVPWILSSRGYGVLVDNDETVEHALATPARPDAWSMTVVRSPDGATPLPVATTLRFRVFAGPHGTDVLRRFTRAVGRQPAPAAPWVFGPWYQGAALQALRDADVPISVSQTYLHYLPCGGDRTGEPARTAAAHALGYAITTYVNPMICTSLQPTYGDAVAAGALTTHQDGTPYVYQYFTSRFFDVGQFDFSAAAGRRAYGDVLQQAIDDGYDGWMEDFGEYTPLDSRSADGRDAGATHNRYPTDYHCAAHDVARRQRRPIVRFQRSGWTGAARCAQVVWGGDPSTTWGFDGLRSVVTSGLGMGLSGVSRWGSDIGGFFSLFGDDLDDELLTRWVQVGAVSGVMRTERDGSAIPAYRRPQVEDPEQLDNWRRYTKLRTQLYPYVAAADREYRRSGLPLMRHLLLAYPEDGLAVAREDEYLFGPDLLVAPVLDPGATTREAYLPAGTWVDFWRAVAFDAVDGALALRGGGVLSGGRTVVVPAPLDELPLFVRAGAVLPLLPPDVDTLADYGEGASGVVRLADRSTDVHLLAFPRGDSAGGLLEHGRYRSRATVGRWRLEARAERSTTWTIEASLATLAMPFTPCAVRVDGHVLPTDGWQFDAGANVLRLRAAGRRIRIDVLEACGSARSVDAAGHRPPRDGARGGRLLAETD